MIKTPRATIRKVFTGTPYEGYIPWLIAMSQHETANWTSKLYREGNNLFGMGLARKRETLRDFEVYVGPIHGNMSGFNTLTRSAEDMILWFREFNFSSNFATVDSFVQGLKSKGYFTDTLSNYLNSVKRFL